MIYELDSTFKSSVTMFIYNLNERVENSKCSASDRIKFRYGVMSNAHLNGERPIFPSSLALQKRVHAVRQYRQMERLRNIIFGGYWANMMPNPLKAPAPPPPLSDHLFHGYQITYFLVVLSLLSVCSAGSSSITMQDLFLMIMDY